MNIFAVVDGDEDVTDDETSYLLCFSDFGLLVGADGTRRGPDLIWRETASHFFVERSRVWTSLSGGVESIDLRREETPKSRYYPSKSGFPALMGVADAPDACLMLERMSDVTIVVMAHQWKM